MFHIQKIKNKIKNKFSTFLEKYGIIGIVASIAVPVKLLLFYYLIGVTSNLVVVWLITCVLTYLLFASFKNKWIPATVYLLLTILMFADVTYSSFFNRYLSVGMLGAAGLVGDITESIKEVIRPAFFSLLSDGVLIYVALIHKKMKQVEKIEISEAAETSQATTPVEPIITGNQITEPIETAIAESHETEPTENITAENHEAESALAENQETEPVEPTIQENEPLGTKIKSNLTILGRGLKRRFRPILACLIIVALILNVSGSFLITSISNQEIYSYHLKDIVAAIADSSTVNAGSDILHVAEGNYEEEKEGPLFGVAKDRNLIVIQVESFQNFVINAEYNGQELTPNLNKLLKEDTIYFDNYYQQVGSGNTSDAEFATNNSIYGTLASFTYKIYQENYFKGLPVMLKEKGYETAVFHPYENRDFWNRDAAYKNIGFDTFYGGIDKSKDNQYQLTEWIGWGLSDTEFFQQTMDYIKKLPQPFYSFIITLSNHHPYLMPKEYQTIDLLPEDRDTIFGNYMNSVAYTDYALGQFMEQLKEEGLYDTSVIAIYGDHLGLVKSDEEIAESMENFLGKPYDFDTMMNVPLIISVPEADVPLNQTVSTTGGQLDFLPTMAYLMGFETLDTLYLGHNLMTIDSGLIAEQTYMTKGSFFKDDIVYEMSRDGVFENGRAWNKRTRKAVDLDDCYDDYISSMSIINASEHILKNDVLRKIYLDGEEAVTVFNNTSAMDYPDEIVVAGAPNKRLMGTNSREALDASYEAGYRSIKVDVSWTNDTSAVLLRSWDALDQYFITAQNGELSYDEFTGLKMKNGLDSMDYIELIAWMKEHEDVTIIAKVQRSADYFMKCMEDYAEEEFERLIVEVPGVPEYSGLYSSILHIGNSKNSAEQIIEYIDRNKVPAVTMSKEAAEGIYKDVLKASCVSYIEEIDRGIFKRSKSR